MLDDTGVAAPLRAALRTPGLVWVHATLTADASALLPGYATASETLRVRGRRLRARGLALAHLSHLFGAEPAGDAIDDLSRWADTGVRSLLARHRLIVLEELDLAHAEPVGWLLDGLHRRLSTQRVVAISTEPPPRALLLRGGVSDCRVPAESPSTEPAAVSDWDDLTPAQRSAACIAMLCDEGPLGERISAAVLPRRLGDQLVDAGLLDAGLCMPRAVRERLLKAFPQQPQRAAAARKLARHVLDEVDNDGVALRWAGELLAESPDTELLRRLVQLWRTQAEASGRLQSELDRLALRGRLPPLARLRAYRANAEGYHSALQRELYDSLREAKSEAARMLAHCGLVRATVWSGLREWPQQAQTSLELALSERAPAEVRRQVAVLWAGNQAVRGPVGLQGPDPATVLQRIGVSDEALQGWRLALDGTVLAFSGQMEEGMAALTRSARMLRAEGYDSSGQSAEQVAIVLLFLANRVAELRELLHEFSVSADSERREYLELFVTLLEWHDGDPRRLQRICCVLPARPLSDDHPLLPRPHFRDYLPFVYKALRDRALDLPPDPELVEIFCEALERLRFFFATGLGAAIFAQHCLLWDRLQDAARLVEVIRTTPGCERPGAMLTRWLQYRSEAPTLPEVLETLGQMAYAPDPAQAPYYMVLATRAVLQWRLDGAAFLAGLSGVLGDWRTDGVPERIVDTCRRALCDGPETLRAQLTHEQYVERRTLEALSRPPSPRATHEPPRDVSALREHIEAEWNQPIRLADYADEVGLAADALTRRFRRAFGVSPKQYQGTLRLERAGRMILETDRDLTTIAVECGFYDAPQLTRAFRKQRGLNPQDFRRRFA